MRIIKTSNSILDIGHQGENLATRVVFPAREWRTLFGDNGTFQLLAQRKGDENPYPVALTIDGENIYWDITSADTAIVGQGKCELQYYLGEILAKSEIWVTKTSEALGEAGEAPEPYQSWVDEVLEAGATAEQSSIMAQHSAEDAEDYARSAQESADSITNMTVSAHSVPSSQEANVEKTIDPITGYVNLEFGIPRGSGGGGSDDFSVTVNGEQFLSVDGDVNIGTVLREHQSLSAYRTAADQDVIDSGKQNTITDLSEIRAGAALGSTAYQLPSDGVPKTDINPSVYASIPVIQATRDEGSRFTANTSGLALETGTIVAIVFDNPVGTSSANVVLTDSILNTSTTAYLRLIDISGQGLAINPPSDWFLANRPYLFQYDYPGGANRYLICVTPRVTASVVQGTMDISQGGTGATTASQARDNLGVAEKPAVKTTMDSIATVNTQYYLGLTDSVTIRLPTDAVAGDNIKCVFYSGTTITSLYITGASYISDEIAINENQRVELNMLYDGDYWAIVSNTIPIPQVIAQGFCGDTTTGDGKNLEWVLTDNNVLSIRGTGRMDNSGSLWSGYEGLIHKANMSQGVTHIGNAAFSSCTSLTTVTISDTVTSIGGWAFQGCSSLTNVTIPNGVTSIGNGVFNGCRKLASVKIPNSLTSMGTQVFYSCTSLTSVTIPNSLTSIGDHVFQNCTSLTNVTIPDSVTSIGYNAFYGCTALTDVFYSGTEEEWNSITFGQGNENLTNATIHYNS